MGKGFSAEVGARRAGSYFCSETGTDHLWPSIHFSVIRRQSHCQNRMLAVTEARVVLPPPLNRLLNEQKQFDLTHPTSI